MYAPIGLVLLGHGVLHAAPTSALGQAAPRGGVSDPNIVLVLTDDQRADTLAFMPHVRHLLGGHGITFTRGYVVNPTCCPSRASILTGNYSHTTGVYLTRSIEPYGGFRAFDDGDTIATRLHDAGYRTGLFGKYLNGYRRPESTYVPPGWDRWFATFRSGYYNYAASDDGVFQAYGHHRSDYGTSVLRDQLLSYIASTDASTPFFAYFAPHAPHEPATPAPSDRHRFSSLPPYRPASYNERKISDKPQYMQHLHRIDPAHARSIDKFRIDQLRSLQSVDRAVAAIVDELRATGRLRDTLIVFTSDNGFLWGEHRLTGKGVIYEEAVRVPFIVRYDEMVDNARRDKHLVLNIDLAPTFDELAAADPAPTDGLSLVPMFRTRTSIRDVFLIEHLRPNETGMNAPTFCAVHTDRYVLVRYETREEELYDLRVDPRQTANKDGRRQYADVQHALRIELRALCMPPPPGYSF